MVMHRDARFISLTWKDCKTGRLQSDTSDTVPKQLIRYRTIKFYAGLMLLNALIIASWVMVHLNAIGYKFVGHKLWYWSNLLQSIFPSFN